MFDFGGMQPSVGYGARSSGAGWNFSGRLAPVIDSRFLVPVGCPTVGPWFSSIAAARAARKKLHSHQKHALRLAASIPPRAVVTSDIHAASVRNTLTLRLVRRRRRYGRRRCFPTGPGLGVPLGYVGT